MTDNDAQSGPATATINVPERRVQTVCLLVLTAIAVAASLQALQEVMLPFSLALFLSIALAPVVDGLAERTRLSQGVSVGLTMMLGALLLAILGLVVASSISAYNSTRVEPAATEVLITTERGAEEGEPPLAGDGRSLSLPAWLPIPEPLKKYEATILDRLEGLLPRLAGILGDLLSQGVTVLIFLMFLLLEQGRARPDDDGSVGGTVRDRVKKYISVKVLTSAVTGIATGLILWALGVPAAVLFGLLAFLLNFIPTIGSIVAVVLPLTVLLAGDAAVVTIVLALALPSAVQFVVGQVWENKLLGEAFDLRASVVLLALVFWGHIWGMVGMLLATPITAVGKTMLEGWDVTRPVGQLMGQGGAGAPRPGPSSGVAP